LYEPGPHIEEAIFDLVTTNGAAADSQGRGVFLRERDDNIWRQ
jgi:hypothetical protein